MASVRNHEVYCRTQVVVETHVLEIGKRIVIQKEDVVHHNINSNSRTCITLFLIFYAIFSFISSYCMFRKSENMARKMWLQKIRKHR